MKEALFLQSGLFSNSKGLTRLVKSGPLQRKWGPHWDIGNEIQDVTKGIYFWKLIKSFLRAFASFFILLFQKMQNFARISAIQNFFSSTKIDEFTGQNITTIHAPFMTHSWL